MNKIRILLLPFSIIYGWVLWLRNKAYQVKLLESYSPEVKTIVLGNLSLGGTGKTPHLEYLLTLLKKENPAVLSRGYGRKTQGTVFGSPDSTAADIGDEPLQIAQKFKDSTVLVDEKRVRGLKQLRLKQPDISMVLFDDALQHRQLKGGFNILLTTWDAPFTRDFYLPAGNLRDHKCRANDVDIIIVSKCPEQLDPIKKAKLLRKLYPYCAQVFFNRIAYHELVGLHAMAPKISNQQKIVLVTGIAKPSFLLEKLETQFQVVKHFDYRDHHVFTELDIQQIRNFIGRFAPGEIAIVTTEKDATRLRPLSQDIPHIQLPIYYWKIGVQFDEDKNKFDNLIRDYVSRTQ